MDQVSSYTASSLAGKHHDLPAFANDWITMLRKILQYLEYFLEWKDRIGR